MSGASLFASALVALAMAGLVRWLLPEWTPEMSHVVSIGLLMGGVAIGISAYAATILLLWLMAGRPAGAERALYERLRQQLLKRGAAPSTTLS